MQVLGRGVKLHGTRSFRLTRAASLWHVGVSAFVPTGPIFASHLFGFRIMYSCK